MRVINPVAGRAALICGAAFALQVVSADSVRAQAMTPMRGEVKSFSDKFALRVFPANPYQHRIKVEVRVYDETFAPVAAAVTPAAATLAPQDNRGFMVVVPFEGRKERRVRVCTEAVPFTHQTTRVRTQVCGRFVAYKMN